MGLVEGLKFDFVAISEGKMLRALSLKFAMRLPQNKPPEAFWVFCACARQAKMSLLRPSGCYAHVRARVLCARARTKTVQNEPP